MRLDQYLTKNSKIQSRNKATELIKSNKIKVNGVLISKPSFIIENPNLVNIQILEEDFFVSRAAYKLKYFLDEINIHIKNKIALDIGSSTGGFTQILLLNEVKNVYCIDVGSNQLHEKIKENKKIKFFENTDIRDFESNENFEIVTCDVSFISIHNILNDINRLAKDKIIILFKPQFEVGKNVKRDKKGVVKDKNAINLARKRFIDETIHLNWKLIYNSKSKLQGKDGNEEELFYFSK
ncbi:TlyA family rRNA (cytidine-2'-O)-methyltransferase [Malaciobacter molluscorum LMG 25693]|uniref:16S/23S rRNA (Cytidine-2'-O)-methyltransferase n=1 Tax=Malaciobacter molluscorum LMG 25693 TaxID=870501 RepID=A0A2G1DEY9_9BACT|nr:TlyA family RNA methyltransferase [Malaciobacter molluscorum]AXX91200.1 16S/23S rRNA (cytidine-2'-O)-methyltransferase [Malaciobacter molluscorum LMG 25693]PHO16896.1 TlyA family rRNA (cytidine-2'-O)-methyltransferase [Malaciobacter molluscorum LMG 25693]